MGIITPGILTSLEGRYASVLFDLAQSHHQTEHISEELCTFHEQFMSFHDLRSALLNPAMPRTNKIKIFQDICRCFEFSTIIQSFITELIQNDRLERLTNIKEIYEGLYSQTKGEQVVEVISAYDLTTSQKNLLKNQIYQYLHKTTKKQPIVYVNFVNDPNVLGGVKIRIGSQVIDATVATQLDQLIALMKGITT